LAREVLVRYGDRKEVQSELIANFASEGWSGEASLHYINKRQFLLNFQKDETDPNVNNWIDLYVKDIEWHIKREKVNEERQDF
jgi:hypothetical protein